MSQCEIWHVCLSGKTNTLALMRYIMKKTLITETGAKCIMQSDPGVRM